jgi:hypothetical protein
LDSLAAAQERASLYATKDGKRSARETKSHAIAGSNKTSKACHEMEDTNKLLRGTKA